MSKIALPINYSNAVCSNGHEVNDTVSFCGELDCDGYPQDRDSGMCLWCQDSGMHNGSYCYCPAAENLPLLEVEA